MKHLGPLSSSSTNSRQFYVDLSNQLDTGEILSTISVSCSDDDVTLSAETILAEDVTTRDGYTLTANLSISFRASCGVEKNSVVPILIDYTTSDLNSSSTTVYLKIVESII